jgi:nitrate reductase NapE component
VRIIILIYILSISLFASLTKDDVRKIIKEENMLLVHYIDKRFDSMQKEMDVRFKAIDTRFKAMDTRFKAIDKRFDSMQKEMDTRFKAIDKRFDLMQKEMDTRFKAIDARFKAVDKRFNDLINFLYILTGIFTTLTLGIIGFAYWDRRTIIKKAKEETIEEIEKEGKLKNLIKALKELSKEDKKLALVLKNYGIL